MKSVTSPLRASLTAVEAALRRQPAPQAGPPPLAAAFHAIGDFAVGGFVLDPARPGRRLAVEIRADGEHLGLVLAESFSADVRARFGGDGCHGFTFVLDPERIGAARVIEAVVANADTVVGAIAWQERGLAPSPSRAVVGEAMWAGGLRVSGFAHDLADPARPVAIEVYVDGDLVTRTAADQWRDMAHEAGVPSGRIGFDVALPLSLADGEVHVLRVTAQGFDLEGSPTVMLVHDAGFAGIARDLDPQDQAGLKIRATMLDRLMPAALPFAEAKAWLERFPVDPPAPALGTAAVLMLGGDEDAAATLRSLERQHDPRWLAFHVPAQDGRIDADAFAQAREAVAEAAVDTVIVATAGTILDPHAVGHLAAAVEDPRAPGLVYADVLRAADGRLLPCAFPAYDRFRMRAQGYCADLFALPAGHFETAAEAGAGSVYDLLLAALRVCEAAGEDVGHLPQFLAAVPPVQADRRAGLLADARRRDAAVRGGASRSGGIADDGEDIDLDVGAGALFPAVTCRRPLAGPAPGVSIVVPTRDRLDLLKPCVDGVLARTRGVDIEIVVVDNGSRDPATLDYLAALAEAGHTVLRADIPFNYSRLNNLAVAQARHDLVCLLNNDIEVLEEDWLAEMAALLLQEEGVGIVGATLLWPSRIVQHGGVVVGPHNAARHAFNACLDGEPGYGDQLTVERRHSVVTAACLLIRRSDYEAVGGLDEIAFPVTFNDVDLCLKVGAAGKTVVMTPRARLLHKESASRGLDVSREKSARARKETAALRDRWGPWLADDPCYNPNLGLDLHPFEGLATPPRRRALRLARSRP